MLTKTALVLLTCVNVLGMNHLNPEKNRRLLAEVPSFILKIHSPEVASLNKKTTDFNRFKQALDKEFKENSKKLWEEFNVYKEENKKTLKEIDIRKATAEIKKELKKYEKEINKDLKKWKEQDLEITKLENEIAAFDKKSPETRFLKEEINNRKKPKLSYKPYTRPVINDGQIKIELEKGRNQAWFENKAKAIEWIRGKDRAIGKVSYNKAIGPYLREVKEKRALQQTLDKKQNITKKSFLNQSLSIIKEGDTSLNE